MPSPGLPLSRSIRILPLLLLATVATAPAATRGPNLSKYPLRVHVLLISRSGSHPPTLVSSVSGVPGEFGDGGGGGGDMPSMGSEISGNSLFPDMPPEFYGTGWADLVSPPVTTQGLDFAYDHCDSRAHVGANFQSLAARWKKPGKQLEVLVPTDDIPGKHGAHPFDKCTFNVIVKESVYLLMRNGKLMQVSQQDYAKKPALRAYITAPASMLEPRRTALPTRK